MILLLRVNTQIKKKLFALCLGGMEGSHSPMLFFFAAGASQVKWNKKNANYLATSHDGDVRIWDKRVSDLPLVTFPCSWCSVPLRGCGEDVTESQDSPQ